MGHLPTCTTVGMYPSQEVICALPGRRSAARAEEGGRPAGNGAAAGRASRGRSRAQDDVNPQLRTTLRVRSSLCDYARRSRGSGATSWLGPAGCRRVRAPRRCCRPRHHSLVRCRLAATGAVVALPGRGLRMARSGAALPGEVLLVPGDDVLCQAAALVWPGAAPLLPGELPVGRRSDLVVARSSSTITRRRRALPRRGCRVVRHRAAAARGVAVAGHGVAVAAPTRCRCGPTTHRRWRTTWPGGREPSRSSPARTRSGWSGWKWRSRSGSA